MIMIGTLAHAIARVIFALAEVPWLFYLGSGISSLGPVVAPVIRAMASKIAPQRERGIPKIFPPAQSVIIVFFRQSFCSFIRS